MVGSPGSHCREPVRGRNDPVSIDPEVFTFDSIERGEMLARYEDVLLEFLDVTSSSVEFFFSFTPDRTTSSACRVRTTRHAELYHYVGRSCGTVLLLHFGRRSHR